MKTHRKKLVSTLILILPLLFLSACENTDTELAEKAFEAWAKKNNLYVNGQWKPEGVILKTVQNTIGNITNSDENVQFDALEVLRDIDKAEDLADEALLSYDTAKMASAISIRPKDWSLQDMDAAIWMVKGNGAAAQSAFTKSDELLRERLLSGGDCFIMRRTQLQDRMFALKDVLNEYDYKNSPGDPTAAALRAEINRVADELHVMNQNKQSDFCGNK
jgi:hypothetical protein